MRPVHQWFVFKHGLTAKKQKHSFAWSCPESFAHTRLSQWNAPGTLHNQFKVDVWFFPTISFVKIWNHVTETTIYKWLFGVPNSSFEFLSSDAGCYPPHLLLFFPCLHASLLRRVSVNIIASSLGRHLEQRVQDVMHNDIHLDNYTPEFHTSSVFGTL